MTRPFPCIGLVGKYGDPSVADSVRAVSAVVGADGRRVLIDEQTSRTIGDHGLVPVPLERLGQESDLVVVIGGDGTLLNVARSLVPYEKPLLGVNMGRRGFLADISPSALAERLMDILGGRYEIEERFLLECELRRHQGGAETRDALNDVVLHKWNTARMLEFDTYLDGSFMNRHRADGLILATPTGSTAYALSAGSAVIHPGVPAITVAPICPHALGDRPMVVDAAVELEIVLRAPEPEHARVTCDGQVVLELDAGDRILIRRRSGAARFVHPEGYDFCELVRAKLGLGEPEAR